MVCVPFLLATVYVGTLGEWLDYGAPCTSYVVAAREGYVVGFNDQTHCPDWTMHRVSAANLRVRASSPRPSMPSRRRPASTSSPSCRWWNRRSWRRTPTSTSGNGNEWNRTYGRLTLRLSLKIRDKRVVVRRLTHGGGVCYQSRLLRGDAVRIAVDQSVVDAATHEWRNLPRWTR